MEKTTTSCPTTAHLIKHPKTDKTMNHLEYVQLQLLINTNATLQQTMLQF